MTKLLPFLAGFLAAGALFALLAGSPSEAQQDLLAQVPTMSAGTAKCILEHLEDAKSDNGAQALHMACQALN